MSEEKAKIDSADSAVAEVDRIRDIIFGPQMRLYEQQFKRLAGQLDLLNQQLESLRAALDQQRAEQESRTCALQEEVQRRLEDLERALSTQVKQLDSKVDKQDADLAAQTRNLGADMRKLGQDLRAEFAMAVDALEEDKASRGHLADLLLEMGTRLKQRAGVADLLGALGKLPEDPKAG